MVVETCGMCFRPLLAEGSLTLTVQAGRLSASLDPSGLLVYDSPDDLAWGEQGEVKMKRLWLLLLTMGLLSVASVPTALAAPPHSGCGQGPGEGTGSANGAWELWDEEIYDAALLEFSDGEDPGFTAADVFAEDDRNRDGHLCVMIQMLPNDASGSDVYFLAHDNTARGR